jgi:hypothetical protein
MPRVELQLAQLARTCLLHLVGQVCHVERRMSACKSHYRTAQQRHQLLPAVPLTDGVADESRVFSCLHQGWCRTWQRHIHDLAGSDEGAAHAPGEGTSEAASQQQHR